MPAYTLQPCLLCGGTGEELASGEEVRAELEALWEFHARRLRPGTPPARLADRLVFSQRPALRLARCRDCDLVWRNPAEAGREVEETYAGEDPDDAVLDALHRTQLGAYRAQARRLTAVTGRPGRVLEVGCHVGGFLAAARELGWEAAGVDVNARAVRWLCRRGFDVTFGELADTDPAQRWDAVALWSCLDQLPDPVAALRDAATRLDAGGVLALRVPNGGTYARLRARGSPLARAVLAHDNLLAFPYRWGFTPRSLGALLERAGLRVVRVVGDALVPIADEWTRPWARVEERLLKGALRAAARLVPDGAPWFEIYARA